ncbi:ER membrane glycoprotein subunit of the GPI transamidase complex-like protein [Diaporthe eres]|uniref:GPI mannosyltransferase 2 n=1 Tax=Diaporthe eres TaxID=83184 RepID=A0ABR1NXZ1_DIAER
MAATSINSGSPYTTLTATFLSWKAVLFAIAAGSRVGPTYDTSSSLLVPGSPSTLLTRLSSWDAIYFLKAAQRGYLFEQEWAFGSALPNCVSLIIRALRIPRLGLLTSPDPCTHIEALVAVIFSNTCHLLSVLVLYQLGLHIWRDSRWALTAALLHVLSPAGLFLSAPYAESACSLLSFTGWLLLVKSCLRTGTSVSSLPRDALTLLAGLIFGLATYFRTNGLLNGAPLAFEFLSTFYQLTEDLDHTKTPDYLRRLVVLGIAGLSVAAGSVVPHIFNYVQSQYCNPQTAGHMTMASDISNVRSLTPQNRNTGFLRYWTLSNAPLFALAAPMLFVMGKGGKDLFFQGSRISRGHGSVSGLDSSRLVLVVRSMVFAQVLLVALAFTSYHVQIITRLSSGYPAWYWWLAACLRSPKTSNMGGGLVVFMIMYASIQAVLFASFLPPA